MTGFALMFLMLFLLIVFSIRLGSVNIPFREIIGILSGREENLTNASIVRQIRLPRIAAVIMLGGALSVSGFLLQTFFRNPIAGPFILGISSGAKLTVALTMIAMLRRSKPLSSMQMVLAAFLGSMISIGIVLLFTGRTRSMSSLVICGIMIGYICSAVTDFAVTFAEDADIVNLHNWSRGSFSGVREDQIAVIALIVLPVLLVSFLISKPMGAYLMGEQYALNVGVNVRLFRVVLILISGILSATVTAFAGPVSFVGVAVPHLMKNLFRTENPVVITPASFLGGAVFCLLSDLIARTAFAPTELSISSVTALFGAPVVMLLMVRRSREG